MYDDATVINKFDHFEGGARDSTYSDVPGVSAGATGYMDVRASPEPGSKDWDKQVYATGEGEEDGQTTPIYAKANKPGKKEQAQAAPIYALAKNAGANEAADPSDKDTDTVDAPLYDNMASPNAKGTLRRPPARTNPLGADAFAAPPPSTTDNQFDEPSFNDPAFLPDSES